MTTQRNFCRLCITQCEDHKSLFDQNGQSTGVYQLMDNYFDSKLLNLEDRSFLSVICMLCWRHIFDFHNFQQFVYEAQEKLNVKSKSELKFNDVDEFLPLESTVSNTVEEQTFHNSNNNNDLDESLAFVQLDNIDVFSVADSYPDDEMSLRNESGYTDNKASEKFFNYDDNSLTEINEIAEILSSDEEALLMQRQTNGIDLGIQGSNCEAVEEKASPQTPHTVPNGPKVINETPPESNNKNKITANALMDDDAIIAEWKPYLECRICNQNYSSFKLLGLHFRKNHPLNKFYVVCCGRKFYYRCKLGEHRRRHIDPYPFMCKFCTKSYTHKSNLISHLHKHQAETKSKKLDVGQAKILSINEFNGGNDSLATTSQCEELLGNKSEHTNLGKCPKKKQKSKATTFPSGEASSSILLNENSLNIVHEDDAVIAQWKPSLKCEVCGQTYFSFTQLREHFREEHPLDTFYIECCRRKFIYRCMLGDHIRRHINPHPFKCKFCTKSYSQRANLITHMQDLHDYRPKMSDKNLDDLIDQWKQELECSHCNQTFASLRLLRHHFRYKHPKKMFHVLCCGRKLTRRREIEGHIRSHLKIFVSIFRCEQCDKCFTARRSLDRHKFVTHKDNLNCKEVDDAVTEHDNKSDIDNTEELDNTIAQWKTILKCMACSEPLTKYSLLQEHYLKEHPNDKCYIVCCRQNLVKRSEIEYHMRLHCSPETYTCPLCDECFINKEDLEAHKQCNQCQTSSNTPRRMSSRQKITKLDNLNV